VTWDIVNADCTKWLPEAASFGLLADATICDPPYHLSSIAKRFGKPGSAPAQHGRDGAAERLSRGFMSSPGDSGDIAFQPGTWRAVAGAMKPGARLAAFGGTRTWWKLAAAIDAAGFEIEDTLMWVYGQGLVLRHSRLKPCWEPILLCRMPGPVLDLGVDDCRIPIDPTADASQLRTMNRNLRACDTSSQTWGTNKKAADMPQVLRKEGRWPGNLILSEDGSGSVTSCFPDAPGQLAAARTDGAPKQAKVYGALNHIRTAEPAPRDDSGSAARFFTRCDFSWDERRVIYQPKAPSGDRIFHCTVCDVRFRGNGPRGAHRHDRVLPNGQPDWSHITGHPTVKPVSLLRHLVKLLCPPGGLVLDPFAGTATTCEAAVLEGRDAIGIELDPGNAALATERMRGLSA
jgi:site-specific DNA-methyltransferase (adenine-specific)